MAVVNLPASVLALVELSPIEDVALVILKDGLVDIPSYSLIPETVPDDFIVVRRAHGYGLWKGDERFTDWARITVHVLTKDPDGDEKGALLSEAVRVVMRNAWLNNKLIPGRGYVSRIEMRSEPSRVTDWATASGPVQFADLPTGYWRYETTYGISIRKPL